MRLWSLHESLLDSKGLVALWREGLLAQKVLLGLTTGYRFHPQLERFRATRNPVATISAYLWAVVDEARARGYNFDASKISTLQSPVKFVVRIQVGANAIQRSAKAARRRRTSARHSRFIVPVSCSLHRCPCRFPRLKVYQWQRYPSIGGPVRIHVGAPETLTNLERKSWKPIFLGSQDSDFQLRPVLLTSISGFLNTAPNAKISHMFGLEATLRENGAASIDGPCSSAYSPFYP